MHLKAKVLDHRLQTHHASIGSSEKILRWRKALPLGGAPRRPEFGLEKTYLSCDDFGQKFTLRLDCVFFDLGKPDVFYQSIRCLLRFYEDLKNETFQIQLS